MSEPLEAAERRRRELASTAKRLRTAVMTDPGRAAELADTLVELVENRLLAWAFAEAAAEAPDSVVQSARILAAGGPVGPYANATDAGRYYVASVQLAAVQAELGQPEAAGRTLDSLEEWRGQLGSLRVLDQASPVTAIWALVTRARAWLATDVALANAAADAALLRLYAAGLDLQPASAYLAMAAHLTTSDARWAAGQPESSLAHHRLAIGRYRGLEADLIAVPKPAERQLLQAPLAELYQRYVLRLELAGDPSSAIATAREWLALEERLCHAGDARGPAARAVLAQALARAGRNLEAAALGVAAGAPESAVPRPGEPIAWQPLSSDQAFAPVGLSITASVRLQRDEQAAIAEGIAARGAAEVAEAQRRRAAEQAAATAASKRAEAERRATAAAQAQAQRAAEIERERAEEAAVRQAAVAEAERAAAEARRQQLAAARAEARAVAAEAVETALAELDEARGRVAEAGDELVPLAAAQERLAAVLRPLALADAAQFRDEYAATLEALVSHYWRLGNAEASREAARQLKAL